MKSRLSFLFQIICLAMLTAAVPVYGWAADDAASSSGETSGSEATDSGSGSSFFKGFMEELGKAAKGAADQKLEEWAGTYEGRIGDVTLVESSSDTVVLEVQYEKVKRSDGVFVQAEVLSGGEALDGFTSTVSQVRGKRGKSLLTLRRIEGEEDPWGLSTSGVDSDQLKLFLVRETHPDHPFGFLYYDFPKTWGEAAPADEPSAETASSSEEAIELAEGENLEGGNPAAEKPPAIQTGTVLKPVTVQTLPAKTTSPTATRQTVQKPARAKPMAVIRTISSYDFYADADKAQWRAGRQALPFPGGTGDKRGFVRRVPNGYLSTGNKSVMMLQTHPEWQSGGWIAGLYPAFVPGQDVHFKAVAGFLKGADHSDGATFIVQVYEKGRYTTLIKKQVTPAQYVSLDGDLSRWAGKKIQLILRVNAGKSSAQDWAVWVKPRLAR
jgi:hypothetical protein